MFTEYDRDRDGMHLLVQGRSPDVDPRIEEAEQRLANTLAFLDRIAEGEHRTREHAANMLHHIERELRALRSQLNQTT
jgi:hypothetical protein